MTGPVVTELMIPVSGLPVQVDAGICLPHESAQRI